MLWLLHFHSIQILIVLWILQLIYTAYATLAGKIHHVVKSFVIVLLFATSYYSIIMSGKFLGTPNFSDEEQQGILNGFSTFIHDDIREFAVFITTSDGPLLITLPYTTKLEAKLDEAMKQLSNTGRPTMIRKRSPGQMSKLKKPGSKDGKESGDNAEFDNGQTEMFDFTDQVLAAKPPVTIGK
jgi:hypothetical protein